MIIHLLTLIALLDPTSAGDNLTARPETLELCDELYNEINQSLLNLNCTLHVTVYRINTKLLTKNRLSIIDILKETNLTWSEAISSVTSQLRSLMDPGSSRKREVIMINITTCFDFMRQLEIMVNLLQTGSLTKTYQISTLRPILLQLNDILENILCNAKEKEFISSQMNRIEYEMTSLNEYLSNITFSTTISPSTGRPTQTSTKTSAGSYEN